MSLEEAIDGKCHYYLTRKRRYCRFQPKEGQQYCPEHACIMGIHGDRKRIPCPLNPSHNCYEDELKNHVKKCNVTKVQKATQEACYFIRGINKGTSSRQTAEIPQKSKKVCVKDLTSAELAALIARVNKLYEDHVEVVETAVFEHPCVKEEHCRFEEDLSQALGEQAALRKELLQQASLVGQLDDLGLLTGGHCFVEMGAGKGKLSHWIQKASKDATNNSFLLIERSSVRYKMDSFHKQAGTESEFKRIKIDIEDLCLGCVELGKSGNSVVMVGKHLCGGATDMGIRCVVETLGIQKISHYCSNSFDQGHQKPRRQIHSSAPESAFHEQFDAPENVFHEELDAPESVFHEQLDASESVLHEQLDAPENVVNIISPPAASSNIPKVNVPSAVSAQDVVDNSSLIHSSNSRDYNHSPKGVLDPDRSQPDKLVEGQDRTTSTNQDILKDTNDTKRKDNDTADLEREQEPPTKAQKLSDNECRQKLPKGIMIALCCHHYCTWDAYLGQDFMQSCGVTPQEFDLLTRLSSWATCAKVTAKSSKNKNSSEEGSGQKKSAELEHTKTVLEGHEKNGIVPPGRKAEDHGIDDLISMEASKPLREQLSVVEREAIGSKCKRLIDTGRLHYLRSKGMTCCLRRYISEEVTPENIVLIAHL